MLIDTNVAIHLRDGDHRLAERLADPGEQLQLSLVSVIELRGGQFARPNLIMQRTTGLQRLLRSVTIVPVDASVVDRYADIVRRMGFSRRRILDRLIAATALVHDLTLVTINGEDFADIPGLKLEVWPTPAAQ